MKNKRLLWMLAGGALVFLLMIAYLIDLLQPDFVPQDKAATST